MDKKVRKQPVENCVEMWKTPLLSMGNSRFEKKG